MEIKSLMVLSALTFLAACTSSQKVHRGVVAMKINDSTAHVGLNQDEVKLNDHVQLYSNKCTKSINKDVSCQKIEKGHGTVTQIISPNYVAVKFDDGVSFQEGDVIERHSHE